MTTTILTALLAVAGVVKLSDFGYNAEDATEAFQKALKSDAQEIVVDRQAGPWYIRAVGPITTLSGRTITVEKDAVLCAKRGEFKDVLDTLLDIRNCKDVVIRGEGTLRMWRDDYLDKAKYKHSEWRHAVSFQNCKNVRLEGLKVELSGGDGLYLNRVENSVVRNCDFAKNDRQGVSVISVKNCLIENCVMRDTYGTPPAAGIDYEPNEDGEQLVDCVLRNCTLVNNQGSGILVALYYFSAKTEPVSMLIENCTVAGNGISAYEVNTSVSPLDAPKGQIVIRNSSFTSSPTSRHWRRDPALAGFAFYESENFPVNHIFDGVTLDGKSYGINEVAKKYPTLKNGKNRYPARRVAQFDKYEVVDKKPGEMVKLSGGKFRDPFRLVFYAAKAGTVNLVARHCQLGAKAVISKNRNFIVRELTGKAVMTKPMEEIAFEPTKIAIEVPSAGFYTIEGQIGQSCFEFLESEAPLAIDLRERAVHLYMSPAQLYLPISAGNGKFAIFGGGAMGEAAKMTVKAADGKVLGMVDNANTMMSVAADGADAAGMVTVDFAPPSTMTFDDYYADLCGAIPYLFLTNEKYWQE